MTFDGSGRGVEIVRVVQIGRTGEGSKADPHDVAIRRAVTGRNPEIAQCLPETFA
jgi:hypothetical protein